jgi:Cu-processing system ATP-binding protein
MISVQGLHKKFGKLQVLQGVDIELDKPGIVAILGPNGSGKTTLMKSILGMVIPDKGEILVGGQNIKSQWNYRATIDYLPQIARFPDNLRVNELISMIKNIRGQEARDQELIELFGLGPHMKKKLGNLSGGTRQKVNVVLTFMHDNPLLFLDEPTSGLDPVSMISLKKMITEARDAGKTILLTTHIMPLVEQMADEIVFLLDGKIYFRGSPENIIKSTGSSNLEAAIAHILTEQHA